MKMFVVCGVEDALRKLWRRELDYLLSKAKSGGQRDVLVRRRRRAAGCRALGYSSSFFLNG